MFNRYVYGWEYTCDANDTINILCTYTAYWGGGGGFLYRIGTGGSWHSTIGTGKITFDISQVCSKHFLGYIDTSYYIGQRLRPMVYDNSIVYSFKDYEPKKHEVVTLSLVRYWTLNTDKSKLKESNSLHKSFYEEMKKFIQRKTKSTQLEMLYEILARNGYKFKSNKLYSKKNWNIYKKGGETSNIGTQSQAIFSNCFV